MRKLPTVATFAATAFFLASAGCGGSATPPPRSASLTDGDRGSLLPKLQSAMTSAGNDCSIIEKRRLLCVTKNTAHVKFFVVPVDTPIRAIGVVAVFKLKVPCATALARLNKLNSDLDLMKTTCDESGSFIASGAMVVPEGGITGADLSHFVDAWIGVLAIAFNAYGLPDVLE